MLTQAIIASTVVANPRCPKCGAQTILVRIFPLACKSDERIYECSRCDHEVSEVIQFRMAS
jgi:predicted RNA-binding Zn-ribbon protein involved in translation (DUF1610 family)